MELLTLGVEQRVRLKNPETYLVIQETSNCYVKKKKKKSTMVWKTGDWTLQHRSLLRLQTMLKEKSKSCPENSAVQWGN